MKYIFMSIFVFIVLFFSFSQQMIEVLPINMRQSTQLYFKKGEKINIEVSDKWSLWDKYTAVGGEGHSFKANNEYGNWGALLGSIGDGDTFLVGNKLDTTSDAEGILYLFPNKGKYLIENATGKLLAAITGGQTLTDFINTNLTENTTHYTFASKEGILVTDLFFELGEKAEIYAFGSWTMWDTIYPKVNTAGHDFLADDICWGKLYAGLGSNTGQYITAYSVGQKSIVEFNESGILSFFPYISDYVTSENGEIDIYVIGGKKATDENIQVANNAVSQHFTGLALSKLNEYRKACKLPDLMFDTILTQTAINHSKYMLENNTFSRNEVEGNTGYTEKNPEQRAKTLGYTGEIREMFCQTESVEYAIDILFNTVYHRLRLMNPNLKHLGYGSYKKGKKTIHVFDFGYDTVTTNADYFIYPEDLATDTLLQWNGFEQPAPLLDGIVKPVGSPITVLFKNQIASVESADLTNIDSQEKTAVILISQETDINSRQINAVVLVPENVLSPLTNYSVDVKVKYKNGEEKEIIWQFKTKDLID